MHLHRNICIGIYNMHVHSMWLLLLSETTASSLTGSWKTALLLSEQYFKFTFLA